MIWQIVLIVMLLQITILLHECAHAVFAAFFKIKIKTLRIGFGRVIWGKKLAGTNIECALLPLGGYAQLDEQQLAQSSLWQRQIIWLAGPMSHLLIAWALIVLAYLHQIPSQPVVIEAHTPTEFIQKIPPLHQKINSVESIPIHSWGNFIQAIVIYHGKIITAKTSHDSLTIDLRHWRLQRETPDILKNLGITPYLKPYTIYINAPPLFPTGSILTHINGLKIRHGHDLVTALQGQIGQKALIQAKHNTDEIVHSIPVNYRFGTAWVAEPYLALQLASTAPETQWHPKHFSISGTFTAWMNLFRFQLSLLKGIVSGSINWQILTGPVGFLSQMIKLVSHGQLAHILLGLASLNFWLFFLNLLPIPPLDGGRFMLEFFKPSKRLIQLFNRLGIITIATFIAIISINEGVFVLEQWHTAELMMAQQ